MRFHLSSLFFAAIITASTSPGPTDSTDQILADLQRLNTDLQRATPLIKSWNGTSTGSAEALRSIDQVIADLSYISRDLASSPQLNDAGSTSIISYINSPVEPSWASFTNATGNALANGKYGPYSPRLRNDLNQLKGNLTTLTNNLIAKSSSGTKSAAASASAKLMADLNRAIQAGGTS